MVPDIAHLIKGSVFPILAAFKNEVVLSHETAALKCFLFLLAKGTDKERHSPNTNSMDSHNV